MKEVDLGPDGEWHVHGVKRDASGGHSWCRSTEAWSVIKETTSRSHRAQVLFGSDVNPHDDEDKIQTHVVLEGRNNCHLSKRIDDDLSSRTRMSQL